MNLIRSILISVVFYVYRRISQAFSKFHWNIELMRWPSRRDPDLTPEKEHQSWSLDHVPNGFSKPIIFTSGTVIPVSNNLSNFVSLNNPFYHPSPFWKGFLQKPLYTVAQKNVWSTLEPIVKQIKSGILSSLVHF